MHMIDFVPDRVVTKRQGTGLLVICPCLSLLMHIAEMIRLLLQDPVTHQRALMATIGERDKQQAMRQQLENSQLELQRSIATVIAGPVIVEIACSVQPF